jgi:hypothetical protein
MKILVASMGRTGSVLLSNIIRDVHKNTPNLEVGHCHYFHDDLLEGFDIVVSSKRDFREQMASTKRYLKKVVNFDCPRGGLYTVIPKEDGITNLYRNNILQEAEMALKIYHDWEPHTKKYFILEDYFTNPSEYIKSVFDFFKVTYDDNLINELVIKYKTPIRPDHITKGGGMSTYQNTLTTEEIQTLDNLFNEFSGEKDNFIYLEKQLK